MNSFQGLSRNCSLPGSAVPFLFQLVDRAAGCGVTPRRGTQGIAVKAVHGQREAGITNTWGHWADGIRHGNCARRCATGLPRANQLRATPASYSSGVRRLTLLLVVDVIDLVTAATRLLANRIRGRGCDSWD
jgi:hypothetical protein